MKAAGMEFKFLLRNKPREMAGNHFIEHLTLYKLVVEVKLVNLNPLTSLSI